MSERDDLESQLVAMREERDEWKRKWEIAEENRGALSFHAGQLEGQLDKREAEIERLKKEVSDRPYGDGV